MWPFQFAVEGTAILLPFYCLGGDEYGCLDLAGLRECFKGRLTDIYRRTEEERLADERAGRSSGRWDARDRAAESRGQH